MARINYHKVKTQLCKHFDTKTFAGCTKGTACFFAHGNGDLMANRGFCSQYLMHGKCVRGTDCTKVHHLPRSPKEAEKDALRHKNPFRPLDDWIWRLILDYHDDPVDDKNFIVEQLAKLSPLIDTINSPLVACILDRAQHITVEELATLVKSVDFVAVAHLLDDLPSYTPQKNL